MPKIAVYIGYFITTVGGLFLLGALIGAFTAGRGNLTELAISGQSVGQAAAIVLFGVVISLSGRICIAVEAIASR